MRKLLFFSRVTFICNICFVLTWLMRYMPAAGEGHIASTILILGIGLSFMLNILVNFFIIVFLLQRKPVGAHLPRWLMIANILFLIPQLILLIK